MIMPATSLERGDGGPNARNHRVEVLDHLMAVVVLRLVGGDVPVTGQGRSSLSVALKPSGARGHSVAFLPAASLGILQKLKYTSCLSMPLSSALRQGLHRATMRPLARLEDNALSGAICVF